jgi:hypothetical protein
MVEVQDTGWLTVFEKKGLHQSADILENYGINSETDVSVFDRDDFCKLTSRVFKPLETKKLDHWCEEVDMVVTTPFLLAKIDFSEID